MTIAEILKELEPYTGQFPMAAMKAAIEQQTAITPELLRVLENVAENPAEWAKREDYMLHLFAIFLLAQFREKRAYRLIAKIVSAPGEIPFDLFGDAVTESLSQILGSVYDGDPEPLERLIENKDVNEYVRSAAIDAFLVLVSTDQIPREQVVNYFRSLFEEKLERVYTYPWCTLVSAVGDMHAPALLKEVRKAFHDGLIDPLFITLSEIEKQLKDERVWEYGKYTPIWDAISEMEWWASFLPEDSEPKELPEEILPSAEPSSNANIAHTNPYTASKQAKTGRNDSCPCGSGKKYKKCCGK